MRHSKNLSTIIPLILITAAAVLILNLACARGAGVWLLNLLGYVELSMVDTRENVLRGVALMQNIIFFVSILGLMLCAFVFIRSFKNPN